MTEEIKDVAQEVKEEIKDAVTEAAPEKKSFKDKAIPVVKKGAKIAIATLVVGAAYAFGEQSGIAKGLKQAAAKCADSDPETPAAETVDSDTN